MDRKDGKVPRKLHDSHNRNAHRSYNSGPSENIPFGSARLANAGQDLNVSLEGHKQSNMHTQSNI